MSGGHPVSADRSGTETAAKRIPNVRLKVATEQHCFHEDAEFYKKPENLEKGLRFFENLCYLANCIVC